LASTLSAETTDSEWALFKRNISPAMMWGEDSLMLVPKANTMGRGNLYFSATALDAGKIQNQRLFLTTGSVMFSSSEDVELGYSKRVFIWDDGDYTNIKMDTYHLKARIFHLTDNYIPQISVGVNLASIAANDYSNEKDILYNPYVVATINAPLGTDEAVLTLTAMAEEVVNEGESTEVKFAGGVDLKLFKTLYIMGEIQGIDKEGENGIINIGAKLKAGWFSVGAGMFNISRDSIEANNADNSNNNRYWMVNLSLEIPFNKMFKGGNHE
jgi:hypothetical protein